MSERPTAMQLAADIVALGHDHRDVVHSILVAIVSRAKTALPQYGALNLRTDDRDFRDELIAELIDGVAYAHKDNVKMRRQLAAEREQLALARQEIERLRSKLAVGQRLVPR